jgi:LuxR family maltose regulon positive regulatory protein
VLRESATLARPGGVIRPFIEFSQTVVPLLRMLLTGTDGEERRYVLRLLAALGHDPQEKKQASGFPRVLAAPGKESVLMNPLTRRERDVVALLALRLTDKEMAERLCISLNTVNSHLKHIYRKLEVNDRHTVVIKAQSLGILQDRRATARPVGTAQTARKDPSRGCGPLASPNRQRLAANEGRRLRD